MIERMNSLLEENDIMVRIGHTWYRLEEIDMDMDEGTIPIFVTDDDGETFDCYDMADVDEFDPMFKAFKDMDMHNMGIA